MRIRQNNRILKSREHYEKMAFMMPVVKKNYALYASPGSSGDQQQRQRKTSDQVDKRGSGKNVHVSRTGPRRKTKSEGQSMTTSAGGTQAGITSTSLGHTSKPVEIGLRRVRGSAPILVPGTLHASFQNPS